MKKFKNFAEMSMSVTLKPKKNNMYKVTKVGDKMKAHGGIKKGEKFHDSDIDGMHDSGIKVKYAKPKKIGEAMVKDQITGKMRVKGPSHVSAADINNASKKYAVKPIPGNPKYKGPQNPKDNAVKEAIQRRMDRKTIIATDPATGRKVIKIAPKKEVDIGKGKQESFEVQEAKKKNGLWANIHAKRARGEKMNPKGHKDAPTPAEMKKAQESVVNEISDTTKASYIKKAGKEITNREKMISKIDNDWNKGSGGEYIQKQQKAQADKRRAGVRVARGKLGEAMDPIGKSGRHDIHHTDTSDYNYHSSHASKVSHGGKGSDEAGEDQYHYKFKDHKIDVNDNHTDTKMSHVQQRVKASGVSPKHHDTVSKNIHKHITQESVMSEQMKINELKISTMQKYKRAAKSDIQTGENARHKGYPEKDIDKQQNKRFKGLDTANKRIAKKQVKMAKGVAFDKRYKGGNMTGATNAINKIKPGLADHPKVSAALKRANEEFNKGE